MRGQPLVFLMTVVLVWTTARIIHHLPEYDISARPADLGVQPLPNFAPRLQRIANATEQAELDNPVVMAEPAVENMTARPGTRPDVKTAIAHQLLWAEALTGRGDASAQIGSSPLADGPLVVDAGQNVASRPMPGDQPNMSAANRRWSIYAWSLVRKQSGGQALAPVGQYGGSQAGLVIRYPLGAKSVAPVLYARATAALADASDRTLAIGLSARPLAGVPLDIAVERRFGLTPGLRDRYVAMAVVGTGAELARSGLRIDAYAQAGVVGLNDRLGFFDLQMLATRPLVAHDQAALSVGGGVWSGGQQERTAGSGKAWLHRVDIGPRTAISLPVKDGQLILALDWRQRVDGRAQPSSGAALTLSAGF